MQNADLRGRRANSDDVPALQVMWRTTGLDAAELDPRFTEFQVIEDALGTLVAAIGIRIVGQDALLHSETIPDFGLADTVRPLMWERLKNLAKNNGLARIWTQESAPFWKQLEFTPATGEQLAKLPVAFRKADGSWMLLVMRDEDAIKRVEQEFELFRQQERARVDELKSQGKVWQWVATTIAIFLFVFVVVGAVRLLKNTQRRNDSRIERMAGVHVVRLERKSLA